jgi:hypothetical protein
MEEQSFTFDKFMDDILVAEAKKKHQEEERKAQDAQVTLGQHRLARRDRVGYKIKFGGV